MVKWVYAKVFATRWYRNMGDYGNDHVGDYAHLSPYEPADFPAAQYAPLYRTVDHINSLNTLTRVDHGGRVNNLMTVSRKQPCASGRAVAASPSPSPSAAAPAMSMSDPVVVLFILVIVLAVVCMQLAKTVCDLRYLFQALQAGRQQGVVMGVSS